METVNVKRLIEERSDVVRDLNALCETIAKEQRNFSDEEKEKYDTLERQQKELFDRIDSVERLERQQARVSSEVKDQTLEAVCRHNKPSDREKDLAFRGWVLAKAKKSATPEIRRAMERCAINGDENLIVRDQSIGTGAEGGNAIDGNILFKINTVVKTYGGMQEFADVVNTDDGRDQDFIDVDDTANEADQTDELPVSDIADEPVVFGDKASVKTYDLNAAVHPISYRAMKDMSFDLVGYISELMGIRMARKQNKWFTNGLGYGSSQPYGINTEVTVGKTTAASTAITFDEVQELLYSVDVFWHNNAALMMNPLTYLYFCKQKDLQDRPLFLTDYRNDNGGRSMLNFPVVFNYDMPAIGADGTPGKNVIIFGSRKAYTIRQVGSYELFELTDSKFRLRNSIGLVSYTQVGGRLTNKQAVRALKAKA